LHSSYDNDNPFSYVKDELDKYEKNLFTQSDYNELFITYI